MDVMTFANAGKQLAIEELGIPENDMRIIMHRDGYPTYQKKSTGDLFALKMESGARKVLRWYKYWGVRNGEDVFHIYEPAKLPGIEEGASENIIQSIMQFSGRNVLPEEDVDPRFRSNK